MSGYYTPVASRDNLQLLTGHRVNEIIFNDRLRAVGVRIQPRESNSADNVRVIRANNEIILAAGTLHSPQLLQRSGIGPSWLLNKAGVEVLVDLPGVGSNLQDHPVGHVTFNCITLGVLSAPNQANKCRL